MNKLDEKIINWSQQQFNIKVNDKKSLKSVLIVINLLTYNSYKLCLDNNNNWFFDSSFLREKNGPTFQKLMSFMSDRIKSKQYLIN